jgi:hypothetical protein
VDVIRYSMATAAITTILGGMLFIVAAQFLKRDVARTLAEQSSI